MKDHKNSPNRKGKKQIWNNHNTLKRNLEFENNLKDDLESIGFLIVYFLKGPPPWQNIQVEDGQDLFKKVLNLKLETSIEILIRGLPEEFQDFL